MPPFRQACKNGYVSIIRGLIEDPENASVQDNYGKTPLQYLKETVKKKDANGMLPLHQACKKGYISIICDFIEVYPDSSSAQDNYGKTPLQYLKETVPHLDKSEMMLLLHSQAAHYKGLSTNIFHFLFDANPESIQFQDKSGLLPFHRACLNQASSLDALFSLLTFYPESIAAHCCSLGQT
mmetsp:Transcript_13078/g.18749  ORF Transcript_13078/g.18749 Transcript_13078/m.18749 type:complete len:181 (-) Transcript_13078:166-708(-)